jgi:hypothetical protein
VPESIHIRRVYDVASEIAEQNALMRELLAKCVQVLKASPGDTFIGRKTCEPFPIEDKE